VIQGGSQQARDRPPWRDSEPVKRRGVFPDMPKADIRLSTAESEAIEMSLFYPNGMLAASHVLGQPSVEFGEWRGAYAVDHHGGADDEATDGPRCLDACLPIREGGVVERRSPYGTKPS
jgi:hypothetical protein